MVVRKIIIDRSLSANEQEPEQEARNNGKAYNSTNATANNGSCIRARYSQYRGARKRL